MATTRLSNKALFVQRGYGQVEPNHLSAQVTGQIYAQLPAAANIDILENGQFVKYDYANGVVDFGASGNTGEWMLVYNEVKVYRDGEGDNDFAMKKSNYGALVYSPVGDVTSVGNARNYSGVVAPASPYEPNSTADPFKVEIRNNPKLMPTGTVMVPRVFKTNVGDIYTTNCVAEASLAVNDLLTPGADGYLTKTGASSAAMKWQVVKVYTMPDRQPAVKLMRIA